MQRSSRGAWLLCALGWLGCDDEKKGEERLPLPALALPSLGCRAAVEPAGECARDAECGSERCVLAVPGEDRETPALSCGAAIGTGAERARCEQGDSCQSGLCALGGVCLAPCASGEDCERGQICQAIEVHVADGLSPVMACTRSAAFQPDVSLQEPVRASLAADGRELVLGGAGAGSSLLYLKTDCAAQPLLLSVWSRDSDEELYSLEKLINGEATPNPLPATGEGALLSLLVPNNPRVVPSSQGYELEVVVDQDTPADLVVASRERKGRVLDLNVFYVGGGSSYVTGGFHPGDAQVSALLDRLADRYEAVDLSLGAIREYEVTGALRDELSVIELEEVLDADGNVVNVRLAGLAELLSLSAGLDDGGINVFLVSDMGPVLGVSGGIPGALGVHGTSASGVAIALDVTDLTAENVLMHEISHQMGLFHTSELNGAVIEPLSDTAACHPERDANGDGQLDPAECKGAGADNLMFWAGVGYELSAQQREILQRSLILR